jgi:hypothetical protein
MKLKLTITEDGLVCQFADQQTMTLHGSVGSLGADLGDEVRIYGYRQGNQGCIRVSQHGQPENFYLPVGTEISIQTGAETHE